MAIKISELELEKRVHSIEKNKIVRVWYQFVDIDSVNYNMNHFHSIDLAIYFKSENNTFYKIYWADELGLYHGYGISIKEIPLMNIDEGAFIESTNDPHWKIFIGKKIVSARLYWQNVIDNMRDGLVPFLGMGHIRRADYPQTLEINFDDGNQVFISVLKITNDCKCIPFTNHLSVFFQKVTIDQYYKPLRKW